MIWPWRDLTAHLTESWCPSHTPATQGEVSSFPVGTPALPQWPLHAGVLSHTFLGYSVGVRRDCWGSGQVY